MLFGHLPPILLLIHSVAHHVGTHHVLTSSTIKIKAHHSTSNTNTNHFAIIVSQWLQLAVVLYSQSMHQPLILFIILHIFIINITIIHQTMAESSSNKRPKLMDAKANVLMVGTGEYTTGYVGGTASDSDKGAGVVALTMFDLRRRGKVERVGMCGVNVGNYLYLLLLC